MRDGDLHIFQWPDLTAFASQHWVQLLPLIVIYWMAGLKLKRLIKPLTLTCANISLSPSLAPCPVSYCFEPESLVFLPDGMGGRTGLTLAPGRPGEEGSVGETLSETKRGASGVRPESMWPAKHQTDMHYSQTRIEHDLMSRPRYSN